MSVFGIVSGVRRGCRSGAKDGEGSVRRYRDNRARISMYISGILQKERLDASIPSWSASKTSWYV